MGGSDNGSITSGSSQLKCPPEPGKTLAEHQVWGCAILLLLAPSGDSNRSFVCRNKGESFGAVLAGGDDGMLEVGLFEVAVASMYQEGCSFAGASEV